MKSGGWMRTAGKKEPPAYLESEFFTKVGEQILIPVSCLAVQPHDMVGTPRDPASNQLQYPTQTLRLGRSFKRHLMLLRISPFLFPTFTAITANGADHDLILILQTSY